jgi:hypothetical protein
MGTVAANAHHNGNAKSASRPRIVKVPQKIFLCMPSFYRGIAGTKSLTRLLFRKHGVQEPLSQHFHEIRLKVAKGDAHADVRL